jgi:hypothetical protein
MTCQREVSVLQQRVLDGRDSVRLTPDRDIS